MSKPVNPSSEYCNFSCLCFGAQFKKQNVVKVSLLAFSLLLIGLGLAVYFSGNHYLPQVFSTSTNRIIGAAAFGGGAIVLDVIALIYHLCTANKKAVSVQAPKPIAPEETVKNVYAGSCDLEGNTRIVLLAEGNTAYSLIDHDFFEVYNKQIKTKGIEKAFKEAADAVRKKHEKQRVGIICCYDPFTHKAYIAGIGQQIRKLPSSNTIMLVDEECMGNKSPDLTFTLSSGENLKFSHESKDVFLL